MIASPNRIRLNRYFLPLVTGHLLVTACAPFPGVSSVREDIVVRPAGELPPYPYGQPAEPSVGASEVAGCVIDGGRPVQGLEVSLVEERSWRSIPLKTGPDGVYRTRIVRPGRYHVHYYNDRDIVRVGFWKTRSLELARGQSGIWPAWDVHLKGMRNEPSQGASVVPPLTVRIVPHVQALRVWFRLHDRGGPGGQAHFVSPVMDGRGQDRYRFPQEATRPGFQLWGYQWDAGAAGEGGCLFQDISIRAQ